MLLETILTWNRVPATTLFDTMTHVWDYPSSKWYSGNTPLVLLIIINLWILHSQGNEIFKNKKMLRQYLIYFNVFILCSYKSYIMFYRTEMWQKYQLCKYGHAEHWRISYACTGTHEHMAYKSVVKGFKFLIQHLKDF